MSSGVRTVVTLANPNARSESGHGSQADGVRRKPGGSGPRNAVASRSQLETGNRKQETGFVQLKLLPQPQERVTFGFSMANPAPINPSLKSKVEPLISSAD